MPIKYIPYSPNTVEGQAVLDNITRTQRVLRYRENNDGEWFSSTELKIDKLGYVIVNGEKIKNFWDDQFMSKEEPQRIKVRNISGDELIVEIKNK